PENLQGKRRKVKYNFQSSHGEATITSQNFPELMGLIISAECWDTDSSDLPTILMQGVAKLNDGRAVRLKGSRDVLDKYGHPPTLVIEELTAPVLELEYITIDSKDMPKLPHKSLWEHWWYDGKEITQDEAIKIVDNIPMPTNNYRIHLDIFGYKWQRKSLVPSWLGLGVPVWVQ
ncbi:MAG: hypothetical protein ACKOQ2_21840, partial [Dolichospermum sp.]